jgi:UDP-N-acetylenolpyruvoylglucosamine reductase
MTNQKISAPYARVDLRALEARIDGEVVVPGDEEWDTARLAWNLAADQRPAFVAFVESPEDIVAVVDFARVHGLKVAPQATGHFALNLDSLDNTVLVKTTRMRGLSIDIGARTARAEAGVIWQEVVTAAGEHGLAALAGSSPDVGVVGYTLGGGIGWLSRKYGLAANSVVAIELVTADGRIVRADREQEPDLFWALRGGGANFGIVTAIEFALYPVAEVYAGWLAWPIERAAEVLSAWSAWAETTPVEVTSAGRLLQVPPLPDIPEALRGRSFVVVEAAVIGTEADGRELLASLRALAPEIDTFQTMPAPALSHLHMDPEQPVAGRGDGMMLAELPKDAVAALVDVAGAGSGSPLLSVELRQLGGALAAPSLRHGAISSLDAGFAVFAVGMTMSPEMEAAVEAHVDVVLRALGPWAARRAYHNFTERSVDAGAFFAPEKHRRLRRIKAAVDPEELFVAAHGVRPSGAASLRERAA